MIPGGKVKERLTKLFAMLGSDNARERETAQAKIEEILRKNRKNWNDLTELLQNGTGASNWDINDEPGVPALGPVRRAINLVLGLALTVGSAFASVYLLFYSAGFRFWMPVASGVGVFVGLYWLWADYINADPKSEQ
jgi:hypothetical protein